MKYSTTETYIQAASEMPSPLTIATFESNNN